MVACLQQPKAARPGGRLLQDPLQADAALRRNPTCVAGCGGTAKQSGADSVCSEEVQIMSCLQVRPQTASTSSAPWSRAAGIAAELARRSQVFPLPNRNEAPKVRTAHRKQWRTMNQRCHVSLDVRSFAAWVAKMDTPPRLRWRAEQRRVHGGRCTARNASPAAVDPRAREHAARIPASNLALLIAGPWMPQERQRPGASAVHQTHTYVC